MKKPKITIEVYRAKNKEFAWRARHRNGRIVADGAETYKRKDSLLRSARNLFTTFREGDYQITEK